MIKEPDGAEDLYADGMAQVRMDTWLRGRIALVGDAAFCPSPLTGQGTCLARVGAYVLARELAGSIGHAAALARYEKRLRPYVLANQDIDIRTGEGIDEAKIAFDFDARRRSAKARMPSNEIEVPELWNIHLYRSFYCSPLVLPAD